MNFNDIVKKYNELLEINSKNKSYNVEQQIIDLLNNFLLHDELTNRQKIWAYWNISDNYALQKKYENTYQNHLKFEDFIRKTYESNYILMLICDTTQRLSLIEGGYSNYWSNLYFEATNNISINDSNYCIMFEVFRTALYPIALKSDINLAKHAILNMKKLVDKYNNDSQQLRFKILYYSCKLSYNYTFSILNESSLLKSYEVFKRLKPFLKTERIIDKELFGTYESWNIKRSLWYQSRSINDYIITLIDTENYKLAYKCYIEIEEDEFTNKYFKKKIKHLKEKLNLL